MTRQRMRAKRSVITSFFVLTNLQKKDVVISVENTGTENIYVSLSTFDLKELDCDAWQKHLKSDW